MTRKFRNLACEQARVQVSLGVDGKLSDLERRRLDAHLAQCAACAAYEADVNTFTGLLRSAELQPLPRPIALPRRQRAVYRHLNVAAATAAVLLLAVGSVLGVRGPGVRTSIGASEIHHALTPPTQSAYLQSSDYEQRLIAEARARHAGGHTGRTVPL